MKKILSSPRLVILNKFIPCWKKTERIAKNILYLISLKNSGFNSTDNWNSYLKRYNYGEMQGLEDINIEYKKHRDLLANK